MRKPTSTNCFQPFQDTQMKNFIASVLLLFIATVAANAQGSNTSCSNASPFCTGTQFNFPAGTSGEAAEAGPDYGCLGSEPNPSWYFLQIENTGTINIHMVGTNDTIDNTPTNDIDFICYGPFTSLVDVCSQLTADNTVDCSYSGNEEEDVNIPNGITGEYYMILITNFSQEPCNIIFSQNSGSGSTSCGPFNNGPLCAGQDLELVSFFNEVEYAFSWTGPNGFTSTEANPVIPNITEDMAGVYTLVTTNPTETFTGTTTVEISPSPNPSGFIALGDSCTGGSLTFTPDSVFSNAIYTWTYPDGSTHTGNPYIDNNINPSMDGGISLSYEIDGCFSPPVTEFVKVNPNPQPVIEGDNHSCFDGLVQIGLTEVYDSYTWSNSSTQPINFVNQGTFTVTVIDSNGCTGVSAPFTVTNSQPDAQFTGITAFCEGDSILLIGSGTYDSYIWYTTPTSGAPTDTLANNDSLYYGGGQLTLEVTDNFGCTDTINSNIESTLPPVASFTREPSQNTVFVNVPIQFTDTSVPATTDPIDTWDWNFTPPSQDFTDQNPLIAFPDTGVQYITLIVTSELGCIDTTTSFVYIVDDPFVPNAISPDGDGINDYLKIPFLSGFPGNKVVIYNRWGKKVYEGDDYKNDWNGDDLPAGTYFYVVNAPNMKSELKGSVTILRN